MDHRLSFRFISPVNDTSGCTSTLYISPVLNAKLLLPQKSYLLKIDVLQYKLN